MLEFASVTKGATSLVEANAAVTAPAAEGPWLQSVLTCSSCGVGPSFSIPVSIPLSVSAVSRGMAVRGLRRPLLVDRRGKAGIAGVPSDAKE